MTIMNVTLSLNMQNVHEFNWILLSMMTIVSPSAQKKQMTKNVSSIDLQDSELNRQMKKNVRR